MTEDEKRARDERFRAYEARKEHIKNFALELLRQCQREGVTISELNRISSIMKAFAENAIVASAPCDLE